MKWHKGRRRGYHHGNLREALMKAALDLIADKGPAGFTFAEAARSAGVSPAAPYRHYRDRAALLADIAVQGFGVFRNALTKAWDDGQPAPHDALVRMGKAYLRFAKDNPAFYAAMFEAGLPPGEYPEMKKAADGAFDVLREAAETVADTAPDDKNRPPPLMLALHIWSLAHGVASLFGRGDGASRALPMEPDDLLEAATLVYLRGLGLPT